MMQFRPLRTVALAVFSSLLAGCSGGGGSPPSPGLGGCGTAETTFCLVSCNLGCSLAGNCAVTEIAQNQTITLSFSQDIDPSSVNAASFSIKTARGEAPIGQLRVSGNRISFVPELIVSGGLTSFGFRNNETYLLSMPGGGGDPFSLRSTSGDRLALNVLCTLQVTLGLVDLDGLPPSATLVTPSPAQANSAPADTPISLQFSELIETAFFQTGDPSTSPVEYQIRRAIRTVPGDPTSALICDPDFSPVRLRGTPVAAIETVTVQTDNGPEDRQVTVVSLLPEETLPPRVCVEVLVTDRVRDLVGNQASPQVLTFFIDGPDLGQMMRGETFENDSQLDQTSSSGSWGFGSAVPGQLGGSGVLGSFDFRVGRDLGGNRWLFDTEEQLFPEEVTLFSQNLVIRDGVFEFTDMVIPEGVEVIFRGPNPALIRVRGEVDIQGTLSVSGAGPDPNYIARVFFPDAPNDLTPNDGESGALAGAGGGNGGKGGASCLGAGPDPAFNGEDGIAIRVPGQSGFATSGNPAQTNGKGGQLWPVEGTRAVAEAAIPVGTTGLPPISPLIPAGGGGGGFLVPGGNGVAFLSHDEIPNGPTVQPLTVGGGVAVPFVVRPDGLTSFQHFLVGGSGGGGGPSHTLNLAQDAFDVDSPWHGGGAGAGGGGALGVEAGRSLVVASTGVIEARGGNGVLYGNGPQIQNNGPPSPGGGGSGGSIVIQVGEDLDQQGLLDVSGGAGSRIFGRWQALFETWPEITDGGSGSYGLVRVETPDTGISAGDLGNVQGPPAVTSDNFAVLEDGNPVTGFQSLWYQTDLPFPPRYDYYEIRARIGGVERVFTDRPDGFSPADINNAPEIRFFIQGAQLDDNGEPRDGITGRWRNFVNSANGKASINLDGATAFRFQFIVDRSIAGDVVVEDVKIFFTP